MADIKQAAKWMQEGKRVSRKGAKLDSIKTDWGKSPGINGIEMHKSGLIVDINAPSQKPPFVFFHIDALLADDWELAGTKGEGE